MSSQLTEFSNLGTWRLGKNWICTFRATSENLDPTSSPLFIRPKYHANQSMKPISQSNSNACSVGGHEFAPRVPYLKPTPDLHGVHLCGWPRKLIPLGQRPQRYPHHMKVLPAQSCTVLNASKKRSKKGERMFGTLKINSDESLSCHVWITHTKWEDCYFLYHYYSSVTPHEKVMNSPINMTSILI